MNRKRNWLRRVMVLTMVLVMVLGIGLLPGCETLNAFRHETTGDIIPPEQHQVLPPEQQAEYEPVEVEQVARNVIEPIQTTVVIAKQVQETYGGLFGLWGELAGVAIGILTVGASLLARGKIVKQRDKVQMVLTNVEAGARLTAETVNTVVRPSVELWKQFKAEQDRRRQKAANPIIMPDEVAPLTPAV